MKTECNYRDISDSMIKIEVTPDLPCNFETDNKSNPEELEEPMDQLYRCIYCEKEYKTKGNIIKHFKRKDCIDQTEAEDDNAERSEVATMARKRGPRIIRLADNRFQCRHCDKTYTQKNNLFRHMREDHDKLEKPTNCQVCGKEFYNFRKLHQHSRCHSGKPYECTICYKRFSQVAHVQSHMFTHTGERPYQCHLCDKSFSKSFNLKIHIVRHKGEKQFKCPTCSTEFFTHGELEKHLRIHTAERPYSCVTCGKRFKQNGHLKKHILSHTGQKPYKCTICQKDYVNSSHLKKHVLSHSGVKQPEHPCPICGNKFSEPSTVKRHIAKVHKKSSNAKKA